MVNKNTKVIAEAILPLTLPLNWIAFTPSGATAKSMTATAVRVVSGRSMTRTTPKMGIRTKFYDPQEF
jgi:hypothetical protein